MKLAVPSSSALFTLMLFGGSALPPLTQTVSRADPCVSKRARSRAHRAGGPRTPPSQTKPTTIRLNAATISFPLPVGFQQQKDEDQNSMVVWRNPKTRDSLTISLVRPTEKPVLSKYTRTSHEDSVQSDFLIGTQVTRLNGSSSVRVNSYLTVFNSTLTVAAHVEAIAILGKEKDHVMIMKFTFPGVAPTGASKLYIERLKRSLESGDKRLQASPTKSRPVEPLLRTAQRVVKALKVTGSPNAPD